MKAERRHELKQNALARIIEDFPGFWAVHGNKVLTGLVIVMLLILAGRYWLVTRREQQVSLADSVASARGALGQLRTRVTGPPEQLINERMAIYREVKNAADAAIADSSNEQVVSEALLMAGDANWTMANLPAPPPSTQAAMTVEKDPDSYLKEAADAYQEVIDRFGGQTRAVARARFGLAAIAENQRNFERARELYQAIEAMAEVAPSFQTLAKVRRTALDQFSKPILIAEAQSIEEAMRIAASQATTREFDTTQAASGALGPVLPATAPATAPATVPSR